MWIGVNGSPACLDTLRPVSAFAACDLGNGGNSIRLVDADGIRIGGKAPKAASCTGICNFIAFNGNGVSVEGTSRSATIAGNSIFMNDGQNVDLGADGHTLNDGEEDLWDEDTGPNNLQDFPEITRALDKQTEAEIDVVLHSVKNKSFVVEFYASETCSDNAPAEHVFFGSGHVQTDDTGQAVLRGRADLPIGTWVHHCRGDRLRSQHIRGLAMF